MWVEVGPGSTHDNPLLVTASTKLVGLILPQAFALGDHAFHGCFGIVVPYTHLQMLGANAIPRGKFNHSHSWDRMTSEHGVMFMKLWGVIQGRSDIRFYENEELFFAAVDVCWA